MLFLRQSSLEDKYIGLHLHIGAVDKYVPAAQDLAYKVAAVLHRSRAVLRLRVAADEMVGQEEGHLPGHGVFARVGHPSADPRLRYGGGGDAGGKVDKILNPFAEGVSGLRLPPPHLHLHPVEIGVRAHSV